MSPPFDQQVTFLFVADLERAATFYGDVLGLPLVLDQGSCRIFRVAGDAFVGVCEREAAADREGVIVTLVTSDVDGWHRLLTGRGVEFEQAPTYHAGYDIYHTFLRDPDGHLLEIQQFRDPRWPGVD